MGATLSGPYGTTQLGQKKLILGAGGDINVSGPGVATRQAEIQVENGVYWVADLNSKLGTTVNGRRLEGGERQMLHNGDVIGIAGQVDFTFHQDADQAQAQGNTAAFPLPTAGGEVSPRSVGGPASVPSPTTPPNRDGGNVNALITDAMTELRLDVPLNDIQTEPGSPVEIKAMIENLSTDTENYTLKVEGLDPRWYRIPVPTTGNLNSISGSRDISNKRELSIVVNPPRSVQARAGVYSFLIKAIGSSSNVQAIKPATLTVLPFTGFEMTLDPPVVYTRRDASYQLVLVNLSNMPADLSLQAKDPQQGLLFRPIGNNNQVRLEPGDRNEFLLRATPRRRPIFGSPKNYSFTITAKPLLGQGSDTKSVNGQLTYRPLIPFWAILGALLGLVIAAAGAGFLFIQGQRAAEIAATAAKNQRTTNASAQNTAAAQQTATQIAAPTATARAVLQDSQAQAQATLTAGQLKDAKAATAAAPANATAGAKATAAAKVQGAATAGAQAAQATTQANAQATQVSAAAAGQALQAAQATTQSGQATAQVAQATAQSNAANQATATAAVQGTANTQATATAATQATAAAQPGAPRPPSAGPGPGSLQHPGSFQQICSACPLPPRTNAAGAFAPSGNQFFTFGGFDGKNYLSDLWAYSPATNTWQQLASSSLSGQAATNTGQQLAFGGPSGRAQHSVVWDSYNNQLLVFGGFDGKNYLNDLWAYTPGTRSWKQLISSTGIPPARALQSAVYDEQNHQLLIFGGFDGTNYLGDLWAFSSIASAWRQPGPTGGTPTPRAESAATWDSVHNQMFLFGGFDGKTVMNDLWAFKPSNGVWRQAGSTGIVPPARSQSSLVWDSLNSQLLLFGGFDGTNSLNDLWAYFPDQLSWQVPHLNGPSAPSARSGHIAIFAPADRVMLILGGLNPNGNFLNDLFRYDPGTGGPSPAPNPITLPKPTPIPLPKG